MDVLRLSWPLATCLAFAVQTWAAPAVRVDMTAAFDAGPYLLELVETAAGENSSSYFPLLDRIANGHFAAASSDAELHQRILHTLRDDGHITTPEALATFDLALGLRSSAPRIEAHYQYYATTVEPFVAHQHCDAWVLLEGKQYCTPELDIMTRDNLSSLATQTLPFDRVLGSLIGTGKEAILYADPTSNEFAKYHQALSEAARSQRLNYRLRYRRSRTNTNKTLYVSGYGVELALKKTDYIVIDDRAAVQSTGKPHQSSRRVLTGAEEEGLFDLEPLSTTQLASIGIKAASFILESDTPFETLVQITGDFPRYASSIASHNASDEFVTEHQQMRAHMVRDGINFLWINGAQLIDRQIEPFALIDMLRRERRLVDGIRDLGFDGDQAITLLGHDAISSASSEEDPQRYDWTDAAEGGNIIIWLNDLEMDKRYESYPKRLSSLLQRTFPGQIPPIRKNIFHLVFPADLSIDEDLEFIAEVISIIDRGVPIRFGLVPLQTTDESKIQAKVAYYLAANYNLDAFLSYMGSLARVQDRSAADSVLSAITEAYPLLPQGQPLSAGEVAAAEDYVEKLGMARDWIARLQADTSARSLFVDGVAIPRDRKWLQTVSTIIVGDLQTIQQGVYHGILDEQASVADIFLDGAASRRSHYMVSNDDKSLRILNIAKLHDENTHFLDALPVLDAGAGAAKQDWVAITVLADVSSAIGLTLMQTVLSFKQQNPAVRVDVIDTQEDERLSFQVISALKANRDELAGSESLDDLKAILNEAASYSANEQYAQGRQKFLSEAGFPVGSQFLLINGRVVGPMMPAAPFVAEDLQVLVEFEQTQRIRPVFAALEDLELGEKISSPIAAAKVTSIIAVSAISGLPEGIFESAPTTRSTIYNTWNTSHTALQTGDPRTCSLHIVGLLDPASEKAQRWAPILRTIAGLDGAHVRLILNPVDKVDELPVKRFYRHVFEPKPNYNDDGSIKPPKASFKRLPSEALMTAGMDVPPAWLVASKLSMKDLDNIKLSVVEHDVEATYQLQHILIEGHSRDEKGSPPRGAQLVLGTAAQPLLTDTIIMANLGFFQFKANPGVYQIQLKEGRSSEIYAIESIGANGWEPTAGDEGTQLALMDFQGATLYPRLKRKPGMEESEVLDDSAKPSDANLMSKGLKLAEGLFGAKSKSPAEQKHAEINIFSVASGHLYERMLYIMMVSVMRHTKHSVKFWFIEQFLSPSFKEFIPSLADEYGFKYEMVTYKWPHWLRQQKEKQREIWGYKILFLDVLFPLSLNKVIFVDADQIVRTDMIDLVNFDLHGAPYGFTPMCDSRTEMEGFRFWKQGYWANYLRGKPYHISALYVVDLRRFRDLAAGDRLRQQYHALSADPASLSNLDQDLPNHMQFQIPIRSLPQEWLWCETWCSDESLVKARTIDLCNNPMTKEPKLDRARRQVPEWTTYDDEVAALSAKRGLGLRSNVAETPSDEQMDQDQDEDKDEDERSKKSPEHQHQKDEL